MENDEIYNKLRVLKPKFPLMNIKRLAVYGSRARGDSSPESDVDLLIEFIETPGFFGFFDTRYKLEEELGVDVDLTTFDAARQKRHMTHILGEAKDV